MWQQFSLSTILCFCNNWSKCIKGKPPIVSQHRFCSIFAPYKMICIHTEGFAIAKARLIQVCVLARRCWTVTTYQSSTFRLTNRPWLYSVHTESIWYSIWTISTIEMPVAKVFKKTFDVAQYLPWLFIALAWIVERRRQLKMWPDFEFAHSWMGALCFR